MHQSSLDNMRRCCDKYLTDEWHSQYKGYLPTVWDIGSKDVNGSYRDLFHESKFRYVGLDLEAGANVNFVIDSRHPYNLEPARRALGSPDLIISGQALEHVPQFWLLFYRMAEMLYKGGLMFLITPSSGPIHRFPVDCYRFLPDSYQALADYSTYVKLLECWQDATPPWRDLTGVFKSTK